jgi:hypothetical protein
MYPNDIRVRLVDMSVAWQTPIPIVKDDFLTELVIRGVRNCSLRHSSSWSRACGLTCLCAVEAPTCSSVTSLVRWICFSKRILFPWASPLPCHFNVILFAVPRFCAALPSSPVHFHGITTSHENRTSKNFILTVLRMWRWYTIFMLSTVWSGESSADLEKLGETWWKPWLSSFPLLDYQALW